MAVESKSSLRRTSMIGLAMGALAFPAIAQAAPEERGNWRQRVAREDAPRAERAEQVRQAAPQVEQAPRPQQAQRRWSPPPQAQGAEHSAPQPGWNDGDGERRVRNETRRSGDGQAQTWQGRTAEAERVSSQPATRTRDDWRSRVQRPDYDHNRDPDYWRKRDWGNHWDRSRRTGWSGWNDQWNWTWGQDYRRWNTRWRGSSRYDWYGWRNRYPSYFQVGAYYSPYRNYSYRRLSIGYFLDSLFFGQDYWIADPGYYHLPEAYGPYRWVRYYDDAVLVNIYDGEVVDVIYRFFW